MADKYVRKNEATLKRLYARSPDDWKDEEVLTGDPGFGPAKALAPLMFSDFIPSMASKYHKAKVVGQYIRKLASNPAFDFGSEREVQQVLRPTVKEILRSPETGTQKLTEYLPRWKEVVGGKGLLEETVPAGSEALRRRLINRLSQAGFVDPERAVEEFMNNMR
jgi:hypothetical protein